MHHGAPSHVLFIDVELASHFLDGELYHIISSKIIQTHLMIENGSPDHLWGLVGFESLSVLDWGQGLVRSSGMATDRRSRLANGWPWSKPWNLLMFFRSTNLKFKKQWTWTLAGSARPTERHSNFAYRISVSITLPQLQNYFRPVVRVEDDGRHALPQANGEPVGRILHETLNVNEVVAA